MPDAEGPVSKAPGHIKVSYHNTQLTARHYLAYTTLLPVTVALDQVVASTRELDKRDEIQ